MKNLSTPIKIVLTLLVFGLIIHIGGTIVRNAIAFDLYVPSTELQLKNWLNNNEQVQTVKLFSMTALYTGTAYCVALLSAVFLFIHWRKELKSKGWLFMVFILIFLTAPIELYLIIMDLKLNFASWAGELKQFDSYAVREFFTFRYQKLAVPSALSFFALVTAVLFVVWRPLDKSNQESEKQELVQ